MCPLLISWRPSSYKICWYFLENRMQTHSRRDTQSTTKLNCRQLTFGVSKSKYKLKSFLQKHWLQMIHFLTVVVIQKRKKLSEFLEQTCSPSRSFPKRAEFVPIKVRLSDVHEARLFSQMDVRRGQTKQQFSSLVQGAVILHLIGYIRMSLYFEVVGLRLSPEDGFLFCEGGWLVGCRNIRFCKVFLRHDFFGQPMFADKAVNKWGF